MPPMPEARASAETSATRIAGSGSVVSIGEHVEGERQQRVADEDRRRVVIGAVRGGAAAAEVVVVHRRKIVVDEAITMDQLDRRGGAKHARRPTLRKCRAASTARNGLSRLPPASVA